MKFDFTTCPTCRSLEELMSNRNNPMAKPMCFKCLAKLVNPDDMQSVEKFCRTYNIAFDPAVWLKLRKTVPTTPLLLRTYAAAMLDEKDNALNNNGEYMDATNLSFEQLNRLWATTLRQEDIMARIPEIKESFVERARINWGSQYDFEELVKLEDLYYQSVKANSITNPIQKESLRTMLKLMIDINKGIQMRDTNDVKTLTTAFQTLAKTAQLDTLIEGTHTDDITTVAEIVETVEDAGFDMPYYDEEERDAIDAAIHDIEESNARLVKGATGLGPQIEQMMNKYNLDKQNEKMAASEREVSVDQLLDAYSEDVEVEEESDDLITEEKFED